jgi:protein TonB
MLESAHESSVGAASTTRLVIRVKLIPQEPPQPKRRLSKLALLLMLGVVAGLLSWIGFSTFRSDPASPPTVNAVVRDDPQPKPATTTTPTSSPAPVSIEPEASRQPDAPTSAIHEAIPDVPRSALDTIRGTVRVSVRVGIDKQGMVVDAVADDRGPSRYFERLAVESAKQWTFTPATSEERRTILLRFSFTRAGASAQANSVP